MAINISHVVITGINRPDTVMQLHDRIESAIAISRKVEIEGHIIHDTHSTNWYRLETPSRLATATCTLPNVESSNLMFLLGIVAQRIFPEGDVS